MIATRRGSGGQKPSQEEDEDMDEDQRNATVSKKNVHILNIRLYSRCLYFKQFVYGFVEVISLLVVFKAASLIKTLNPRYLQSHFSAGPVGASCFIRKYFIFMQCNVSRNILFTLITFYSLILNDIVTVATGSIHNTALSYINEETTDSR